MRDGIFCGDTPLKIPTENVRKGILDLCLYFLLNSSHIHK